MAYKYDIGNITESRGSYSVRFGNYQDDNFVSKFFGKTEYDNPKKAAEAFHKKIVDSGWSSLRGTMGDSPLRDAIRKAYKEIGKGKNTTTDDIYQKIKNIDVVKGKDKLVVYSYNQNFLIQSIFSNQLLVCSTLYLSMRLWKSLDKVV